MPDNKHKNYELLNLIGYGLAKFNLAFITEFGVKSKMAFYEFLVTNRVAETSGTIKNRQDLFDPFFENDRKGWWQKGNAYIHRKIFIDGLFGHLNASDYASVVKLYLLEEHGIESLSINVIPPIAYYSEIRHHLQFKPASDCSSK